MPARLPPPPAWTAISPVLSPSSKVSDQYITALAIAPLNPNTIYAATADGHVWVTYDGGANWKQRDTGLFDATAGTVLDIRIDISNPKRGFAVTNGPPGMNVWQIRDGEGTGDDWINISSDIKVAYHESMRRVLGTDVKLREPNSIQPEPIAAMKLVSLNVIFYLSHRGFWAMGGSQQSSVR